MRGNREGHAAFGSDLQAKPNRFFDVDKRFFLRPALADTARNCRTLRNKNAVFVLEQSHSELHGVIIRFLDTARNGLLSLQHVAHLLAGGGTIPGSAPELRFA